MSFRLGYGNFYGGYTPKDKNWQARIDGQANLIHQMRVSIMAAVELHEENGAYRSLLKKTPWLRIAEGDGGNQLLYDPKKFHVDSRFNWMLPHNRAATIWRVTHLGAKKTFHLALTHLIASPGTPAQREDQAGDLVAHLKEIVGQPVILCGDFNSYTLRGNAPQAQIKRSGFYEIRDKVIQPVTRGNWDSHKDNGKQGVRVLRGHWIDNIYTNNRLTIDSGTLYPTKSLSDHNWLQATVDFKNWVPKLHTEA